MERVAKYLRKAQQQDSQLAEPFWLSLHLRVRKRMPPFRLANELCWAEKRDAELVSVPEISVKLHQLSCAKLVCIEHLHLEGKRRVEESEGEERESERERGRRRGRGRGREYLECGIPKSSHLRTCVSGDVFWGREMRPWQEQSMFQSHFLP